LNSPYPQIRNGLVAVQPHVVRKRTSTYDMKATRKIDKFSRQIKFKKDLTPEKSRCIGKVLFVTPHVPGDVRHPSRPELDDHNRQPHEPHRVGKVPTFAFLARPIVCA